MGNVGPEAIGPCDFLATKLIRFDGEPYQFSSRKICAKNFEFTDPVLGQSISLFLTFVVFSH